MEDRDLQPVVISRQDRGVGKIERSRRNEREKRYGEADTVEWTKMPGGTRREKTRRDEKKDR